MVDSTQRSRLVRLREKIRSDLWPSPPKISETLARRFPELGQFNREMEEWGERLRNTTEPELDTPGSSTSTTTIVQTGGSGGGVGPAGPQGPQGPQGLSAGEIVLPPGDEAATYASMAKYGGF